METNTPPLYVIPTDGKIEIKTSVAPQPLTLKKPKKVTLSGILQCVGDFVENRKKDTDGKRERGLFMGAELANSDACHVIANYTDRTLILVVNETDRDGQAEAATVTGKLELYPHLAELGINANKEYGHRELYDQLKFYSRFFEDKEKHKELMKQLTTFNAKVTTSLKDETDFATKAALAVIQEYEHSIPLVFTLEMPIFAGTERKKFQVDVRVGSRTKQIIFWLESVELEEISEGTTISLFESEMKRLSDYAVIRQW